jgi:hypothetical protein
MTLYLSVPGNLDRRLYRYFEHWELMGTGTASRWIQHQYKNGMYSFC